MVLLIHMCFEGHRRKYKKRIRDLSKALAWWEDDHQNADDKNFSKRKIIFEDRIRKRRASLESSVKEISKANSNSNPSPNLSECGTDRVLPSHLLRRWKKAGRILNFTITLSKLNDMDR